jgi:tetratricopeptide (TPR) repeat protein
MSAEDLTHEQDVDPSGIEETQPAPQAAAEPRAGLWHRLRWLILLLVLALAAGGLSGYLAGTRQRQAARQQAVDQVVKEQFDLGVQDLQAERYEFARQRFEYVIRLDPGYPGAAERLAEALVALNAPTATPFVDASPTPNTGPVQDLFAQAQAAMGKSDWTTVIDTLIALRAKDPAYQAIAVDGMLFAALRNRGVQHISKDGLLEEGIYDLTRAERFAPLDHDADNWRAWAELYLQANSYMGVDWAQAAMQFAQVFAVSPYLKGDAYIKYAVSAQAYGDQLIAAHDPCAAQPQYEQSLLAMPNATLVPTATRAAELCAKATAPKPSPSPLAETPTPTPVESPTETPTP